jgi:arylsulfatase A-like enzyme
VHPGAKEIPGNGIDDNCVGGDAPLEPTPVERPPTGSGSDAVAAAPAIHGGDNVVIIFIDTLRADHLGFTGYQRAGASLTPRLDAFAKQAVVFRRAFSQAPNTPRSVPSFLTSRYPSQVKFDKVFKNYPTILDDNDLLFEALHAAGLHTIGETSHFYFCDDERYPKICDDFPKRMRSNALQGADEWDNSEAVDIPPSNHDIAGPRIVKKTLAKLDALAASKQKFAMLVHLFEPHSTYMEHPGYKYVEHGTASLVEKYDYEVAFEDGLIGQILDELDKSGLAANTTVVIMADHGEAFGVHSVYGQADFFHGDTLYTELTHVPLMFRVPGVAPCAVDDVVQLVDLAPTIAALFGAKAPASWVGRSLVPAFTCKPGALPPKPAFSELLPAPEWDHEAKAMITADGKKQVYYRTSDSKWEIYDLDTDPEEKTNVAGSDPQAKELEQQLAQWIEGPLAAAGGK